MKQYNGAKAEKQTKETLPAGGYEALILGAEVENNDWGERLRIDFDICAGPYAGFFDRQFAGSTFDDKKWKGSIRLTVPDEQSKFFEGDKRRFNNFLYAVEDSNKGYTWNWDETSLKRLKIGVIFANKEWEYEGKTGWATVCQSLCSIEDIRTGNYTVPADKPLKKTGAAAESYTPVTDEDLPF